jgi:hypothetical protein
MSPEFMWMLSDSTSYQGDGFEADKNVNAAYMSRLSASSGKLCSIAMSSELAIEPNGIGRRLGYQVGQFAQVAQSG